jgi:hypothetical protein
MPIPRFDVVHVSQTGNDRTSGFSEGWAVIATEPNKTPKFASRLYLHRQEAATQARFLAQENNPASPN